MTTTTTVIIIIITATTTTTKKKTTKITTTKKLRHTKASDVKLSPGKYATNIKIRKRYRRQLGVHCDKDGAVIEAPHVCEGG
jgi:hypothetical protein